MVSVFGETGAEIFDILVKLAPAASIVGAIIAARIQFKNARKLNQEIIAKNDYREMIAAFLQHSDIVYRGVTKEGLEELKKDPAAFRKYRMLSNIMAFAMQELYLSIDTATERNWTNLCGSFLLMFKPTLASKDEFPDRQRACLDPRFLEFVDRVTTDDHFLVGSKMMDTLGRAPL